MKNYRLKILSGIYSDLAELFLKIISYFSVLKFYFEKKVLTWYILLTGEEFYIKFLCLQLNLK